MATMIQTVSTTRLADQLGVSLQTMFNVLQKLELVERVDDHWELKDQGKKKGGEYGFYPKKHIVWPSIIAEDSVMKKLADYEKNNKVETNESRKPGHIRTEDGHYVRSKTEKEIDDILFNLAVPHVYEKKLPSLPEYYCDFWIPNNYGGLYIEYWGMLHDEKYAKNAETKKHIYKSQNLTLLNIEPKDIHDIEKILINKFKEFEILYVEKL